MASQGALGREYQEGDTIVRQGAIIDCMFVVQSGEVEVVHQLNGSEVRLTTLGEGDFFGEVPLFERVKDPGVVRATVRALSPVKALTVDRKTIVRRIHEDPSLAYRILETMSSRIRRLEEEVVRLVVSE